MMQSEVKPGTLVRLRSGGVLMTVTAAENDAGTVSLAWDHKGRLKRLEDVPAAALASETDRLAVEMENAVFRQLLHDIYRADENILINAATQLYAKANERGWTHCGGVYTSRATIDEMLERLSSALTGDSYSLAARFRFAP